MSLEEVILKWGSIAGAIAAILSLLYKYAISPFVIKPRRERKAALKSEESRRRDKEAAFQKQMLDQIKSLQNQQNQMRDDMNERMSAMQEDVGLLQGYKIRETHSRLMEQGYASDEEKEAFAALYEAYKARGRNTVAPSYMNDVLELPMHPVK